MNTLNISPKSFLFTTWEGGGNVAPALTVAGKLAGQGHRVRFMCDESTREEALASGVAFRPWKTAPSRPDKTPATCPVRDWEANSPQDGIQRVLDQIMIGPADRYAADLLEELDREPADLVVSSEMLLGAMAACESREQPLALLAANLCFYPLPGMPAFGPGLPPPRNAEEIALHQQICQGTTAMFDSRLDVLNHARRSLGLAPLAHAADQAQAASLFLLATSRAFDFAGKDLPPQIRYVGAQLGEPAWAKPWSSPWPASDKRPLVMVGFSTTFQNHAQALQKVIDAASSMPIRVLVTLGQIPAESLRPADNCVLVPSAPHDQAMSQSQIVVTHGGHGTVMRALRHRRPMLILPHGRDQHENAIRVTERGAGLSLPLSAAPDEIRAALQRLIAESAFAQAARRLGRTIDAAKGEHSATQLLEELASQPCRQRCLAS